MRRVLCSLLVLLSLRAAAAVASTAPLVTAPTTTTTTTTTEPAPGAWSFAGVPRLTLNSDEGIGLGVRGTFYWHRHEQRPYKTAITFQSWATTRLVQHHFLRVDAIDAFQLPLRLEAEAGLFSTLTLPFCGDPPTTACVDDDDTRLRSIEPYGSANARFRLWRQPFLREQSSREEQANRLRGGRGNLPASELKVEAFVGWRGTWYIPGTLFDDDGDGAADLFPYPGSRYAALFPQGEPGFASVLQAGVAFDTRDNEPNPSRGFFVDASVRGSHPALGSAFEFGGANLTARLYAPVVPSRSVVVAERLIVDGVWGDAPWRERVRLGGLTESMGIGGLDVGRGIRLGRYPGRLRLSLQHELRVTPVVLDVWGNSLALPVAFFVDTGAAVFNTEMPRLLVGGGISFRVVWNKMFVMRLDLAVSPEEPGRLSTYSAPNHPW